jgi:hypothetical protein
VRDVLKDVLSVPALPYDVWRLVEKVVVRDVFRDVLYVVVVLLDVFLLVDRDVP